MAPLSERDNLLYFAKLAEQAERYDDMVDAVKKLARLNVELTEDERNTISVAFRNVAGARREKWRLLSVIEEIEESKGNEANVKRIREYRRKIEVELDDICGDVLTVIDDHLLPFNSSVESNVFCNKMKGDFHRYRAELRSDDERKEVANQALKAYELATATAEAGLPPTHFMRLGLALNFSVFYYEVMNSPERACSLARTAYDEALPELDSLSIESYKDSFQMMQLLRDNVILWTADPSESDQVNSSFETRDGCERE